MAERPDRQSLRHGPAGSTPHGGDGGRARPPVTGWIATDRHDAVRLAILQVRVSDDPAAVPADRLAGCQRFLGRVWRLAATEPDRIPRLRDGRPTEADNAIDTAAHRLIEQLTGAHRRNADHRVVADCMAFTNTLHQYARSADGAHRRTLGDAIDILLRLLAPMAPQVTAELWSMRHDGQDLHRLPRPRADPAKLAGGRITMAVQINGRLRGRVDVPATVSDDDAEAAALGSARIRNRLAGRTPDRTIIRAPELVNLVVPTR